MVDISDLLDKNKQWAADIEKNDPNFFAQLSSQQSPDYLWIGCSDSRVPANEIVGLLPGELFVHRNVANVVVHTDMNCLSVIEYAVEVLKVKHIIVCGHYGCGGVKASMEHSEHGLIDCWLRNIKDIYSRNSKEIDALATEEERVNLLCELNVSRQVKNVSYTTCVQKAWSNGQLLSIHGWVYGLKDGLLKDLGLSRSRLQDLDDEYLMV
mgnify:CR=1 FL=1